MTKHIELNEYTEFVDVKALLDQIGESVFVTSVTIVNDGATDKTVKKVRAYLGNLGIATKMDSSVRSSR